MPEENTYFVNHTYIDKGYGGKLDPDDQLQNWNTSSDNISIQNSGGIRPRSFNKKIRNKFKIPSSLYIFDVRYDHKDIDNPWINKIDSEKKTIEYCGDALYDESNPYKKIDNFKGNKIFKKILNQRFYKSFYNLYCPILYFIKNEEGKMTFCGLCHIQKILKYKFEHKNHNVENYKIFFKILPIREVNLKWINIRTTVSTLEDLKNCDENYAPKNWEKIVMEALNGN